MAQCKLTLHGVRCGLAPDHEGVCNFCTCYYDDYGNYRDPKADCPAHGDKKCKRHPACDCSKCDPPAAASDTQVGGDHYSRWTIQPIDFIEKNEIPFIEGNVIKYVIRHSFKNGAQDIDKAIHYLQMLKERRYPDA